MATRLAVEVLNTGYNVSEELANRATLILCKS